MNTISKHIIDANPLPMFIVDHDVAIITINETARSLMRDKTRIPFTLRCGEALDCIHAIEACRCGASEHCPTCDVRQAVEAASRGERVIRRKASLELAFRGDTLSLSLLVSAAPLANKEKPYITLVLEDVSALMQMQDIFTVCSSCNKVKVAENKWAEVNDFFFEQFGMRFSHGICSQCRGRLYPEISSNMP